eukprot:scpid70524/ scgid5179/ 
MTVHRLAGPGLLLARQLSRHDPPLPRQRFNKPKRPWKWDLSRQPKHQCPQAIHPLPQIATKMLLSTPKSLGAEVDPGVVRVHTLILWREQQQIRAKQNHHAEQQQCQ